MKKRNNRIMAWLLTLTLLTPEFQGVRVYAAEPEYNSEAEDTDAETDKIEEEFQDTDTSEPEKDDTVFYEDEDKDAFDEAEEAEEALDEEYEEEETLSVYVASEDIENEAEEIVEKESDPDQNAEQTGESDSFVFVPGYVESPDKKPASIAADYVTYADTINDLVDGDDDSIQNDSAVATDSAFPYSYTETEALKSYFQQKYPEIRDQGAYGTCWAHSAIAMAEFYAINHGMADADVDYSEMHLVYWTNMQGTPSIAGYTGDTVSSDGVIALETGHSYEDSSYTLIKQRGVALESTVPYSFASSFETGKKLDPATERQDEICLTNAKEISMKNTELIKEAIVANGCVGVGYYADIAGYAYSGKYYSSYYNQANNCYYYDGKQFNNHAVVIVGWDDDFPNTNFVSDHRPEKDGAWLVRNSYGGNGENLFGGLGYFWLSYEDKALNYLILNYDNSAWVYEFVQAEDIPDNHYYYDSQMHNSVGYYWHNWAANIFKAQGDSILEEIKEVGFEIDNVASAGTKYSIHIYTDVDPELGPISGKEVTEAYTEGKVYLDGKYTIKLKKPVQVRHGEYYSVVIYRDGEYGICYEYASLEQSNEKTMYMVDLERGQSFYSRDGKSWLDQFGESNAKFKYGNVIISAYTDNVDTSNMDLSGVSLREDEINLTKYEQEYTINPKVYKKDGTLDMNPKLTFSSSNPDVAPVTEDGVIKAVDDGVSIISVSCGMLSANCIVKVSIQKKVEIKYAGSAIQELSFNALKYGEKNVTITVYDEKGERVKVDSISINLSDPKIVSFENQIDYTYFITMDIVPHRNGTALLTVSCPEAKPVVCKMTVQVQEVAKPVITASREGTLVPGDTISISCETKNAEIYYTLDGSEPSTESEKCKSGKVITIEKEDAEKEIILKVLAVKDGYSPSESEKSFVVGKFEPIATTMDIDPKAWTFTEQDETKQLLVKVLDQYGDEITNPEITYNIADEKVAVVESSGLIKAVKNGKTRVTVSCDKINGYCNVEVNIPEKGHTAVPQADPVNGSRLKTGDSIRLYCSSEQDATIYYTLDGSDPTDESDVFNKAIVITDEMAGTTISVNAMAVAGDKEPSDIVYFTYEIEEPQHIHVWMKDSVSWNGSYEETPSEAVFNLVCEEDEAHTESLPADKIEPVSLNEAQKTYKATLTYEGQVFEDTKVFDVEGKEQDWEFTGFDWTGTTSENGVAKAVFSCADCTEVKEVAATVTEKNRTKNSVIWHAELTGPDGKTYTEDHSVSWTPSGGDDPSGGKIVLDGKEVTSLKDAFKSMNNSGKDYAIELNADVTGEKNLTIPKTAKSVTIIGNGHSIEIVGTKLTANAPLILEDVKFVAKTKKNAPAKFTLYAKKGLTVNDGLSFSAKASTVKSGTDILLFGELAADVVNCKGLALMDGGNLKAAANSKITVNGNVSGMGGSIELLTGFNKPIVIKGVVTGIVRVTGAHQADGTQVLKTSAKKINPVSLKASFDVSDITENAVDTHLYYLSSGKACIFGEAIEFNGNSYGLWKDAVAAMNDVVKSGTKELTLNIEGDVNIKGKFLLPKKGYDKLVISGAGKITFTGDISLTGNTVIDEGVELCKVNAKGAKMSGKVKAGKYSYTGPAVF
ncbi:MAG: chitobiase/beta-hexosaminidase C-terminal domain-containing protein [Lachnospiraceae bacterium]|nr:chitobiase/beta-hexosaminidase C-terminal domain-containing protein [Lachnospiraceae bacterium]